MVQRNACKRHGSSLRSGRQQLILTAAGAAVFAGWTGIHPQLAKAQQYIYTGPGGTATSPATGDFNTATNWFGGSIPASGTNTELDFGGSGNAGYTATSDLGSYTANLIQFNSSSSVTNVINTSTSSPDTLTLDSASLTTPDAINQLNSGAFNISVPLYLPGDAGQATNFGGTGSGTLTFSGGIASGSYGPVNFTDPNDTVVFTGTNTYALTTNISAGTVTFAGSGASNGTPTGSSVDLYVGGASGSAVLNVNTTGSVTFPAPNVGGVTGVSSGGAAGAINVYSGTFSTGTTTNNIMAVGTGVIGSGVGGYGSVQISGGTFAGTGTVAIGAEGYGVYTQTGGSATVRNFDVGYTSASGSGVGGSGVATFTGGTFTETASILAAANLTGGSNLTSASAQLNLGTEAGGTARMNFAGSVGLRINSLVHSPATVSAIVNLNSGVVQFSTSGLSDSTQGTGIVNFNGGELLATNAAGSLTYLISGQRFYNSAGVATDNVGAVMYNGGLTVDTGSGNSSLKIDIANATGNGLYVAGGTIPAGAFAAISATNGSTTGYIGAPVVVVSGGSGTGATAVANVSNGVVTGVTITSPGSGYVAGDALTFKLYGGRKGTNNAANLVTDTYVVKPTDLTANGTGALTKLGIGTLYLNGSNSYTGHTNVTAGTLEPAFNTALGGVGTAGNIVVSPGAELAIPVGTTAQTATTAGNPVTVNVFSSSGLASVLASTTFATGTFLGLDTSGGDATISTSISGPEGLVKMGSTSIFYSPVAGTLYLTGSNTYTGTTNVSTGTLEAAGPGSLPGYNLPGMVSVSSGATLAVAVGGAGQFSTGGITTLLANATFSSGSYLGLDVGTGSFTPTSPITGSQGLNKLGAGTLFLSLSNTYSGPTLISAGVLEPTVEGAIPNLAAVTVDTGATLAFPVGGSSPFTPTDIATLAASATFQTGSYLGFDTTGGNFTIDSQITGGLALEKLGTNTLTLTGSNNYSGGTLITSGSINAGNSSALGSGQVSLANASGVSLVLSAPLTVGSITGGGSAGGNISLGSNTLTVGTDNTNTTYAGTISGSGGLVKTGTGIFTLSGTNTFGGGTTVSGGVLDGLTTASLPGYSTPGAITVASGATLGVGVGTGPGLFSDSTIATVLANVSFASGSYLGLDTSAGNFTPARPITGSIGINKLGSGTLYLNLANSYTGGTIVTSGTVEPTTAAALSSLTSGGAGSISVLDGGTVALPLGGTSPFAETDLDTLITASTFAAPVLTPVGNFFTLTSSANVGIEVAAGTNFEPVNPLSGNFGLNKLGAGTLTLNTSNGLLGPVLVTAGTVVATSTNALPQLFGSNTYYGAVTVSSGATLDLQVGGSSGFTAGAIEFEVGDYARFASGSWLAIDTTNGNLSLNSAQNLYLEAPGTSYDIVDSGGLEKLGTGTLSVPDASGYGGGTLIEMGVVNAGDYQSLGTGMVTLSTDPTASLVVSASPTLSIGSLTGGGATGGTVNLSGGSLTVGSDNTSPAAFAGSIFGPGGLTKIGTGTQTLSGTNTYSGGTVVSGGTLALSGSGAFPAGTSLNISSGATVQLLNHSTGSASVLSVSTLVNSGRIDVGNNALDLQTATLSAVNAQIKLAYNGGSWTGSSGITSSAAAADSTHLTALGVIQNNQNGTALYSATGSFEGVTPGASDVLVKDTYYGDTNLDGKVDGSDYSRIDSAYLADLTNPTAYTGWFNGDFNYDGVINGSDYTLIDNAFNTQGAALSSEIASPSAVATAQIASATGGTTAVPEPVSLGWMAMGAIGLLGRRRNANAKR
jgi:autotransporter-associated beta strand protein